MTLSDKQAEFLLDVTLLIQFAHARGFKMTGGELDRTKEMQEIYLKTGKSKTMNSMHLKRLAIDLNFFRAGTQRPLFLDHTAKEVKEILQPIGDFWESLNPKNRWGGNFKSFIDTPHFERQD